jgi:hypothetical protein
MKAITVISNRYRTYKPKMVTHMAAILLSSANNMEQEGPLKVTRVTDTCLRKSRLRRLTRKTYLLAFLSNWASLLAVQRKIVLPSQFKRKRSARAGFQRDSAELR